MEMQRALSPLRPGSQFFPSEELLLSYYLTNKNQGQDFDGSSLIRELELFEYDPFELPDFACFAYGHGGRKSHWYCFTKRVIKKNRSTNSGFWLRQGRVRVPSGGAGSVVLGTKTCFVFYIGDSLTNATRTKWTLYEYALADHLQTPFVLCRVFLKSRKNYSPEIGLSSCYEDIGPTVVRHIGVQHDESVAVEDGGATPDVSKAVTAPLPASPQQESVSGLGMRGGWFDEAMTSEEIAHCIQEGDFIELNDLLD